MGVGKTIIHIGMPRTASTFLQKEFFPKAAGYTFYGVETTHYSVAFQQMLYQDDSLFDEAEFEKTAARIRSRNAILSNELFVGQSVYLNATNRSRTARRLHQFFPDAEIVLLLRNQVNLLQSLYAIGVYSGYTCTPEEFIRFTDSKSSAENPLYSTFAQAENTESYKYSALIELYQTLFTKVHVLLFEDFKSSPVAFAERLCEKLNLEKLAISKPERAVNKSLSARQIKLTRTLNLFEPLINRGWFGRLLFGVKSRFIEHRMGGKKSFAFSPELTEKLKNAYREDNRKLAEAMPEFGDSDRFKSEYIY